MRWTQLASGGLARQTRTQAAYGEVVWSWRRDRGVYFAGGIPQTTVTINAAHRGEHEGNRQTIARGKPGCLGCTCLIRVRFLLSLHAVLRAQSAPGFPCALSAKRANEIAELGRIRVARMRTHVFPRHCEERQRRSNPFHRESIDGLLRFARNDGG